MTGREASSLAAWLKQNPGVEFISRDRAGAYADSVQQGAPSVFQITDRWHLLANMTAAVERFLKYQAIPLAPNGRPGQQNGWQHQGISCGRRRHEAPSQARSLEREEEGQARAGARASSAGSEPPGNFARVEDDAENRDLPEARGTVEKAISD